MIPKDVQNIIDTFEATKDIDIVTRYNEMLEIKDNAMKQIAHLIEDKRQNIGLNSSEVLGEYLFALMCHGRMETNIYFFTEELIEDLSKRMDIVENVKKRDKVQKLLSLLIEYPDLIDELDFPKDKLKILIDDVKSSSEPLNIQKVGTPWGNVRDDMYLRYCEMNLWGEMDLQIEPQISASSQMRFMRKLWEEFKYSAFDEPERTTREGIPLSDDRKEKLKSRRRRDLKKYRHLKSFQK